MNRSLKALLPLIAIGLLVTIPLRGDAIHTDVVYYELTDELKERVRAAAPSSAQVEPLQPRRILVFNLHVTHGEIRSGHPSIPVANYAIKHLSETTGAFDVDFSSDPSAFEKANLEQYDALVFNNTAGMLTEDETLQNNILDFVYAGGGFVGTHAAGATFCQYPVYDLFPEFGEMLGGFENGGHPWKPHDSITLKMDDPTHPANLAFGGRTFELSDEVFQFAEPYSRNRLRVLNSIDAARTDMNPKRRMLPERLADQDFAISWVKRFGRGRVFYTSIGHNDHLYWNPPVLQQLLDAIQFATGDLEGPSTPSAKLTPAVRAQESLGWKLGISAYTFKNNTLFETIEKTDQLGLAYLGGLDVQQVSADIPKPFDHNLTDQEIQAVRSKLARHGITMLTYFVFDIPGDETECRRIFEFGRKMGIETFISEPRVENLDTIEKFCESYDIKLGLHNHGSRLSPDYKSPEQIVTLCEGRSPLIGAACDFGYWVREGIDPLEAIKTLGDRVITLQVHDQNEFSADGHDVPWGMGAVRLDLIFEHFRNQGIQPVMFGLEYSRNWDQNWLEIRQSIGFFNSQSLRLALDG